MPSTTTLWLVLAIHDDAPAACPGSCAGGASDIISKEASGVVRAERDDSRDYGAHAQDMLDTRHAHPLQGGAVAEEEKEEGVARRQRVVARRVGGKTVFETLDVPVEG